MDSATIKILAMTGAITVEGSVKYRKLMTPKGFSVLRLTGVVASSRSTPTGVLASLLSTPTGLTLRSKMTGVLASSRLTLVWVLCSVPVFFLFSSQKAAEIHDEGESMKQNWPLSSSFCSQCYLNFLECF